MRASVSSPHEEVSLTTDTTYYFVLESTANGLLLSSSDKLSVQLGSGSPDPDYPPTENTAPTFVLSDGSLIMEKGADALAVQSDGKILVGGVVRDHSNGDHDFFLARLESDGSNDVSFSGGSVTTEISEVGRGTDWVRDIGLQQDGKIITAGYTVNSGSDEYGLALARYNLDGTLDNSFSDDGIKTVYNSVKNLGGHSIAIQADGKILVGGTASRTNRYTAGQSALLARFNSDGTLDHSFAQNGMLIKPTTLGIIDIALQPDGKIVAIGGNNVAGNNLSPYLTVARFLNDGNLDSTFSEDGVVDLRIDPGNEASSVVFQADGKILVAGTVNNDGDGSDVFITRFNNDGSLDLSWGDQGVVMTSLEPHGLAANDITLQEDGKILLAGAQTIGLEESLYLDYTIFTNRKVVVARYHEDGTLDSAFGTGGLVNTDLGTHLDSGLNIASLDDGKILVSGTTFVPKPDQTATEDIATFLFQYKPNGDADLSFNIRDTLTQIKEYTENGEAIILSDVAQVRDRELSNINNYSGASLSLARQKGPNSDDQFSASGYLGSFIEGGVLTFSGEIIGICTQASNGILKISFNSRATQEIVNKTLRSIKYSNLSENPEPSVIIKWIFNDGNTGAQGTGGSLSTTGFTQINIKGVNDKPEGLDSTISMQKNSSYAFSAADFGFLDYEDGAMLTAVRINNLPAKGTLRYEGATIPAGLDFSADDLANRRLTYTPKIDESGRRYTTFSFNVRDSDGAYSPNPNTIIIDVEN